MLAQILASVAAEVTPIIKSTDWDTIAATVEATAQAAVLPAMGVLGIVISVPVAKKVFKRIAN